MDSFVIGTFNLRNHYWQKGWNGENYPNVLADFIKDNRIKFFGVQELVRPYRYKLQKELGKNYTIVGKYRYGDLNLLEQFNESNAIITNEKVLFSETRFLATVPLLDFGTQMPRILTSVETADFFMVNTHIEYWNKTAQRHQLKKLYRYILDNRDKNPVITGDFNADISKPHFADFIRALKGIGISMIPIENPTYKNQILDYIFIPSIYEAIDFNVINDTYVNEISDYAPVLIRLKRK